MIEKIEPLDRELQEEVNKLEQSQKRLARCEDELSEIDDRVAKLKGEFANRTAEAERLKRNLSIAGETLDKAEGLIGQLSGEQERWKTQAGQLRGDLAKLPMKMLLAAGFATYLAKVSMRFFGANLSVFYRCHSCTLNSTVLDCFFLCLTFDPTCFISLFS